MSEAYWIWPGKRTFDRTFELHNVFVHFRKDFEIDLVIDNELFYVTADQSYRLWINGNYITRGPARGYQSHWPYDKVDIAPWLKPGKNYICAEVYNPGISTFSYVSQSSAGFLSPTIYETASAPVLGDVSNLGEIRKLVDKKIITHGNIDLTFLRDSNMEQVKARALEIMEETQGYPHIIGASDSCLWPGTPPQNLKVIMDLFNIVQSGAV